MEAFRWRRGCSARGLTLDWSFTDALAVVNSASCRSMTLHEEIRRKSEAAERYKLKRNQRL